MATPTEAEIIAQWRAVTDLYEEARNFGEVNAANWVALENTLVQGLETDYADAILAAVKGSRGRLAGLLADYPAAVRPLFREWMKLAAVNAPNLDDQGMIDRLYDRLIASGDRIGSRVFVYGTPAAGGGNAGDGTLLRLTVDERNFAIESGHVGVSTLTCVRDQATGTERHEEVFEFRGAAAGPDLLAVSGSGVRREVAAASARNSLLLNPSFSRRSGTDAVPTDITDWTSSTTVNATNYTFDPTNVYRSDPTDGGTPRALNLNVTENLTQRLDRRRTRLDAKTPYLLRVAWNRAVGAASGTLLLRLGAVNNSVAVAAQAGWNMLYAVATPGQNNWYRQFDEDLIDVAIEWTRTAGILLIDEVMLIPGVQVDGLWYWLIGGATPFRKDDTFSLTDTETGAVMQRWMARGFSRHLPHSTGGGITITDP